MAEPLFFVGLGLKACATIVAIYLRWALPPLLMLAGESTPRFYQIIRNPTHFYRFLEALGWAFLRAHAGRAVVAVVSFRPKPLYGDACNACGRCCVLSQCPISEIVFGPRELCPALIPDGLGGLTCDVALRPRQYLEPFGPPPASDAAYSEAASTLIGAGAGCDSVQNPADAARHAADPQMMRAAARERRKHLSPEARAIIVHFRGGRPLD